MIDRKRLQKRLDDRCLTLAQDLGDHLTKELPEVTIQTRADGDDRRIVLSGPHLRQQEFGSWQNIQSGRLSRLLDRFVANRKINRKRTSS